jgi:hypothetical protein
MTKGCKRAVALAALALALWSAASAAATFTARPGGAVTMTSLGSATFDLTGFSIECRMTLTGSLTSAAIEKRAGTPIGSITEARTPAETCVGSTPAPPLTLPWTIAYESILGALPEAVTGLLVKLVGFNWGFLVFGPFVFCLWKGDLGALLTLTGRNPYSSGLITTLATALPQIGRGIGCPTQMVVRATFALSPRQTLTRA